MVDPAEVRNTVGCGDAMLAGFLAGATTGKDLSSSYRDALAVATAAAVSLAPGEVRPRDIERFRTQVEIIQLDGG
jgi:fructose-1-phosphate kinase PfkB-like protein